jgi:hypothetical protein
MAEPLFVLTAGMPRITLTAYAPSSTVLSVRRTVESKETAPTVRETENKQ